MDSPTALRADIPALESTTYLNYGAHGPSPRTVVDAAEACTREHEFDAVPPADPYEMAFGIYDRTRETVASFLGANADEIALTESTTAGIAAVAGAIDWQPGDVVVRTDLEHPAGILPWQRLERAGVEVRVVETTDGRIDRDEYTAAVSDARLVCFSALTWTHGTRLPVADLVDIAHDAGALTLVDAVQVPGQQPLDVTEWGSDIVAAAGHKWLLGLWGAGFLYVDANTAETLAPRSVGYRSVETPTADTLEFAPGARRFEIGTTNPAQYVALERAIELNTEIGTATIEDRIHSLASRLADGIPDHRRLSPAEPESGLVTIDVDEPEQAVDRLANEGFVVRDLPYPDAIRVSVHAVNTREEIDALLGVLESEW
ncbi:class V aminotransferase [Natrialba hulunbeirensis JCM 10989]|uniref:Class V aminotransferase n=1 Tax=Natrialba hulunbeirensis JCM 10989 TaxID=1227493 RepID=M0A0P5_9EURY|nr:aminotransferase class V-fold PLP-dependent enzyme [Natrialba hulunbeirensis]ELY92325.1 class V aminotransferase [Natrialba hulunbeirensis JCM 10989]